MSKSSYRLFLDENVERKTMRYLENRGHDAELCTEPVSPFQSTRRPVFWSPENLRFSQAARV